MHHFEKIFLAVAPNHNNSDCKCFLGYQKQGRSMKCQMKIRKYCKSDEILHPSSKMSINAPEIIWWTRTSITNDEKSRQTETAAELALALSICWLLSFQLYGQFHCLDYKAKILMETSESCVSSVRQLGCPGEGFLAKILNWCCWLAPRFWARLNWARQPKQPINKKSTSISQGVSH